MNLSDIVNNSILCEQEYGVIIDWKATAIRVLQGAGTLDKSRLEDLKKSADTIQQQLHALNTFRAATSRKTHKRVEELLEASKPVTSDESNQPV